MLRKLMIALGWRGANCSECGFSNAAHTDKDLEWHPDFYPCKSFYKKVK